MLKTLIIIRMKAMFSGMFSKSSKKKTGIWTKILFGMLAVYFIAVFGGLFGGIFASIYTPFTSIGMGWLYFGFMAVMVFMLCFVGSVFMTQNQLYDAQDNDLLFAMPVSPGRILESRIFALVLLNYIYEILIIIPAGLVFCLRGEVTVLGAVFFLIVVLTLPLLVIAASALFGWLIALINTKMRNKNIITMVLSLIFFFAYIYVCLSLQKYITLLVSNGSEIGAAIKQALPPFYHLGVAIYDGDIVSFGIYLLWVIIPFAIVYWILSVTFIKIATTNRGEKKVKYREKSLKVNGVRKALIMKEIDHFIGNPMYMFNAGIGLVFMIMAAIYLAIKQDTITMFSMMFGGETIIGPLICVAFGIMSAMTIISSPTISIEGKTLWISKSSPLKETDVLLAKVDMHILLSLIFVIPSEIIVLVSTKMTVFSMILVAVFPIIITIFDAFLGVVLNLKYPKFDWINEIAAIKQGASPMLAMLVSAGVVAAPALIYHFFLDDVFSAEVFMAMVTGLFVLGCLAMYRYVVTRGVKIYKQLQN